MLRRITTPSCWMDMEMMFGLHGAQLSEIFWEFIEDILESRTHLITASIDEHFLTSRASMYTTSVKDKCWVDISSCPWQLCGISWRHRYCYRVQSATPFKTLHTTFIPHASPPTPTPNSSRPLIPFAGGVFCFRSVILLIQRIHLCGCIGVEVASPFLTSATPWARIFRWRQEYGSAKVIRTRRAYVWGDALSCH